MLMATARHLVGNILLCVYEEVERFKWGVQAIVPSSLAAEDTQQPMGLEGANRRKKKTKEKTIMATAEHRAISERTISPDRFNTCAHIPQPR